MKKNFKYAIPDCSIINFNYLQQKYYKNLKNFFLLQLNYLK